MNKVKNIFTFYLRTIPFVSALTFGYSLQKTNKWSYNERCLEMADDIALSLVWPITAPSAIKNFVNEFDSPPYHD